LNSIPAGYPWCRFSRLKEVFPEIVKKKIHVSLWRLFDGLIHPSSSEAPFGRTVNDTLFLQPEAAPRSAGGAFSRGFQNENGRSHQLAEARRCRRAGKKADSRLDLPLRASKFNYL
jgi:hypothetical protein